MNTSYVYIAYIIQELHVEFVVHTNDKQRVNVKIVVGGIRQFTYHL